MRCPYAAVVNHHCTVAIGHRIKIALLAFSYVKCYLIIATTLKLTLDDHEMSM